MRLFIAEKPSLGRAIADVLPRPHQKGDGFVRCGNGDVVSWCIGHLLEQAEPDAYNPLFKQWRLDHLPIVPEQWLLQPKTQTRKQLTVLRGLVKEASELVHAGDPDREGQLLVDEVVSYLKVPATKRQAMQRLLISDLNPEAVKRALGQLRPNRDFAALSISALARSRADWLYGINLTRASTVRGRQGGVQQVLSVGRVQTPVLGLVVRRDQEIRDFVTRPFYEVRAAIHMSAEQPLAFYAVWQPSEACAAHQDEDGRVLNPKLAQNVASRIRQQPAQVTEASDRNGQQAAPLPYNLSALQIDAAKAFGLSAQQVLDACQSLYEKHQLITYPRSDCRYLPEDHFERRQAVYRAIGHNLPDFSSVLQGADLSLRSKCWNNSKVEAHHAIIPTEKQASLASLGLAEKQLYGMLARQYLLQFYPPFRYCDRRIELLIAGGRFVASQRQPLEAGWKAAMPGGLRQAEQEGSEDGNNSRLPLPKLQVGQTLWSGEPQVDEKHTQPPAHFTDATLLAAMTGIGRFVQDNSLRKILRDTDGLGTEATRASIIELLFKRRFLQRQGKAIHATPLGQALINALPVSTTVPDMTAHWERQLADISERQLGYDGFMQPLQQQLQQLVAEACRLDISRFAGLGASATSGAGGGENAGKFKGRSTRKSGGGRSGFKRSGNKTAVAEGETATGDTTKAAPRRRRQSRKSSG